WTVPKSGHEQGRADPEAPGRKTCRQRPPPRCIGNAVQIAVKVADVILRPMGPRLGRLQHRRDEWIILCPPFLGDYLHTRTLRQLRIRRQHHHAVLDSAFVAHALLLTRIHPQSQRRCGGTSHRYPPNSRTAFPPAAKLASRISEYLREKITP